MLTRFRGGRRRSSAYWRSGSRRRRRDQDRDLSFEVTDVRGPHLNRAHTMQSKAGCLTSQASKLPSRTWSRCRHRDTDAPHTIRFCGRHRAPRMIILAYWYATILDTCRRPLPLDRGRTGSSRPLGGSDPRRRPPHAPDAAFVLLWRDSVLCAHGNDVSCGHCRGSPAGDRDRGK